MECYVAGVKVRSPRFERGFFVAEMLRARVAEISEGAGGRRTGHAHERRAIVPSWRPRPASPGSSSRS